jgi:hypothetical protein
MDTPTRVTPVLNRKSLTPHPHAFYSLGMACFTSPNAGGTMRSRERIVVLSAVIKSSGGDVA